MHERRKATQPKIQRRPGSPHSKKQTPFPPARQRNSLPDSLQSTPLPQFRKGYQPCTTSRPKSNPTENPAKARFTPQQEANSLPARTAMRLCSGSTPKYSPAPISEGVPALHHIQAENQPNRKPSEGQVHPTARSKLPSRPHGNATLFRIHSKVLPCPNFGRGNQPCTTSRPKSNPTENPAKARFTP